MTESAAGAIVLVTKLGAAERQLNAAIRMTLNGEDELAIHTVAAAAFRLIRDVQQARGQRTYVDFMAHALFGAAQNVTAGMPLEPELAAVPEFVKSVEMVVQEMSQGRCQAVSELVARLSVGHSEKPFWNWFNAPANFLKHADSDSDDTLAIELIDIKNENVLSFACHAFINTLGRSTPEIEAYLIFSHGWRDDFSTSFWSSEHAELLRKASPARRRQICRRLLKTFKRHGSYSVVAA